MQEEAAHFLIAERNSSGLRLKLCAPDGTIIQQHPTKEYNIYLALRGKVATRYWDIVHPVQSMRRSILIKYLNDMFHEFGPIQLDDESAELIREFTGFTLPKKQEIESAAK